MRKSIKQSLMLALVASCLAGLAALPGAAADSLTPLPDPPTQEVMEYPKAMLPAYPHSTSVYTLSIGTGSQAGLDALDSVSMCWYEVGGDDTCSDGDGYDPRYNLYMEWTNQRDGGDPNTWFWVGNVCDGGCWNYMENYAINDGSTADFVPDALLMTVAFRFHISDVMAAGTDWQVVVRTHDTYGNTTTQYSALTSSVGWFGAVSQRDSEWFYNVDNLNAGTTLAPGDRGQFNSAFEGFYQANAGSDITYQSTGFT